MENIKEVQITKAYDLKELVLCLKAAGLPIAEEAVESLGKNSYEAIKHWIKGSAVISPNKVDDVITPFLDNLDASVNAGIEKLDLNEDGK